MTVCGVVHVDIDIRADALNDGRLGKTTPAASAIRVFQTRWGDVTADNCRCRLVSTVTSTTPAARSTMELPRAGVKEITVKRWIENRLAMLVATCYAAVMEQAITALPHDELAEQHG